MGSLCLGRSCKATTQETNTFLSSFSFNCKVWFFVVFWGDFLFLFFGLLIVMLYVYVYYVWVCYCVCVSGVTLIFGGNRSLLRKCVNCSRIMRYHLTLLRRPPLNIQCSNLITKRAEIFLKING